MKSFDIATLSDQQLATCVDEYIQRAMRAIHQVSEEARAEYCHIMISANCSNLDQAYEIEHQVNCGWGASVKINGNNVIIDGMKAMNRYVQDKRDSQPTKVQPMLAAPIEQVEEAEFAPVYSNSQLDDGPFGG